MKVQRRLGASIIVEAEGQTPVEVFDNLAALEEAFRPRPCGLCKCERTTCVTRTDRENHKYRLHVCLHCGAEFRLGVKKGPGGELFPQLKDPKSGQMKRDSGWVKFGAPQEHDERAA